MRIGARFASVILLCCCLSASNAFSRVGSAETGGIVLSGDARNGRAVMGWPNGERYEGEFRNGFRHGRGIYTWPSGARYEGDFARGVPDGRGTYRYADGARYEGEFRDGLRDGSGTYTWSGGATFRGDFRRGARIDGKMSYSDGLVFDGAFRNEQPHEGVLRFPDGRYYSGRVAERMPAGEGRMEYRDGRILRGLFRDGVHTGFGERGGGDRLLSPGFEVHFGFWQGHDADMMTYGLTANLRLHGFFSVYTRIEYDDGEYARSTSPTNMRAYALGAGLRWYPLRLGNVWFYLHGGFWASRSESGNYVYDAATDSEEYIKADDWIGFDLIGGFGIQLHLFNWMQIFWDLGWRTDLAGTMPAGFKAFQLRSGVSFSFHGSGQGPVFHDQPTRRRMPIGVEIHSVMGENLRDLRYYGIGLQYEFLRTLSLYSRIEYTAGDAYNEFYDGSATVSQSVSFKTVTVAAGLRWYLLRPGVFWFYLHGGVAFSSSSYGQDGYEGMHDGLFDNFGLGLSIRALPWLHFFGDVSVRNDWNGWKEPDFAFRGFRYGVSVFLP